MSLGWYIMPFAIIMKGVHLLIMVAMEGYMYSRRGLRLLFIICGNAKTLKRKQ